jgi:hypothetical protein
LPSLEGAWRFLQVGRWSSARIYISH